MNCCQLAGVCCRILRNHGAPSDQQGFCGCWCCCECACVCGGAGSSQLIACVWRVWRYCGFHGEVQGQTRELACRSQPIARQPQHQRKIGRGWNTTQPRTPEAVTPQLAAPPRWEDIGAHAHNTGGQRRKSTCRVLSVSMSKVFAELLPLHALIAFARLVPLRACRSPYFHKPSCYCF